MNREKPDYDKFTSKEIKDFFGNEIKVGDRLAKPTVYYSSSSPMIIMCTVTSIQDGKIYLDESKIPIQFPSRCINISYLRSNP